MEALLYIYLSGVLFALGISGRPCKGTNLLGYLGMIILSWFGAGALIGIGLSKDVSNRVVLTEKDK